MTVSAMEFAVRDRKSGSHGDNVQRGCVVDEAIVLKKGESQYGFVISISVGDMGKMPGSKEWYRSFGPIA
jgi:hypothetical protein